MNSRRVLSMVVIGFVFWSAKCCMAQDPAVTTPTAPAEQSGTAQTSARMAMAKPAEKKGLLGFGGKKEPYAGPTEVVVLPPTPMLDEEGRQRLDPDGKPMFNPPLKQQRDKYGHPLFDENHKPVFQTATDMGYDEHGKKIRVEKVKAPKTTPVSIIRGTFTVDGVIGKAELNYDIPDLKFIYLYVPGMGVTVVSNVAFPGAKEQANAFDGQTLTVKGDDHVLQIASDKKLLQVKKPVSAFVLMDRDFRLPSRYPVVGYGVVAKAPYEWPGSKANQALAGTAAPPVPKNLKPTILLSACEKGEMRMPAPKALPGEAVPDQPCVPIAKAEAARKAQQADAAEAATK